MKNLENPATKTADAAEDIDSEHDESSETFDIELIDKGTLNREVMTPDEVIVAKQPKKTFNEVIGND